MALAGCSAGQAASPNQLSLQFAGPPVSLDPAKAGNGSSTVYVSLAYDPLIYLDGDGSLVPDLATSWKFTDRAHKVFELTLRPGVRFSDGTSLTARTAAASMNYFLKAGGGLVGNVGDVARIDAVGAMKVRITYRSPNPEAASTLTQYNGMGNLIGPKGLAAPKSLLTSSDGTGQYVYDGSSSVAGNRYVYQRNPRYFRATAQHFDSVVIHVMGNPNAVLSAAQTGQVQFAGGDARTADAAKRAGLRVDTAPFFNWSLNLVDRKGVVARPLADLRVRQAIALAFDRPAIARALAGPYASGSDQVLLPGTDGYDRSIGYGYNVKRAKSLLAQAGYPHGFKLTVLAESLIDPGSEYAQVVADALKGIGIDVTLRVESTGIAQFMADALSKQYAATLFPTAGTTMAELARQILSGGFNPFGSSDPTLNAILARAAAAPDAQARTALYQQAAKRLQALAWTVPIFATQNISYASAHLKNITSSVLNPNPVPVGPTSALSWRLR